MKKKAKKRAVKPRKKLIKFKFSDTIKAFALAAGLVAFAAFLSFLFIQIYSSDKKPVDEYTPEIELPIPVTNEPENPQVIEKTNPPQKPAITVTTKKTVTQNSIYKNQAVTQHPERPSGTIVFVIDDAGNNLHELEPFLKIPEPICVAVLPGLPHSAEAARKIRAAGKEVLLHQPMEALGAQNPGPGAIYSGMSESEVRSILQKNISEIGPIAGMNNHQGSKISTDEEMMRIILSFCKEQKIFYLDSRTTADTTAPQTAKLLDFPIAQRDVFLDNELDRVSMMSYLTSGLRKAEKSGIVVMIGHSWSPELAPLLAQQLPLYMKQGYSIKKVSDTLIREIN
jgi:polysaccharide deacetylase 2 family uncharacterized protein YibQ